MDTFFLHITDQVNKVFVFLQILKNRDETVNSYKTTDTELIFLQGLKWLFTTSDLQKNNKLSTADAKNSHQNLYFKYNVDVNSDTREI